MQSPTSATRFSEPQKRDFVPNSHSTNRLHIYNKPRPKISYLVSGYRMELSDQKHLERLIIDYHFLSRKFSTTSSGRHGRSSTQTFFITPASPPAKRSRKSLCNSRVISPFFCSSRKRPQQLLDLSSLKYHFILIDHHLPHHPDLA